jgi:hypothetical protein
MKQLNNFYTSIHIVLKRLIEEKSRRDSVKFTSYQLASALDMPRSIITKLTHSDDSKRIVNPKIETLLKIVNYFKSDGFDITVDDLLGLGNRTMDVQSQPLFSNQTMRTISLYSMSHDKQRLGSVDIKCSADEGDLQAYYLADDVQPFFKAGSIFIIDSNRKLLNDTLIAVKLHGSQKVQIKKYYTKKNKTILKSLGHNEDDVILMPTDDCNIVGVVIRINAKT